MLDYAFLENKSGKTKWETEFELEKNRFTIKFNTPTEIRDQKYDDLPIDKSQAAQGVEYDKFITMDQRMSVIEMKIRISSEIGMSLDSIIFMRGGSHGSEIKEDDITLKAAALYNNVCIYVQKGIPSK